MELNSSICEEVEALQAILLDSVDIERDESGTPLLVRSTLYPATAEDSSQQYVCTALEVTLPRGYPEESPSIKLRNSRGLSELMVKQIEEACERRCEDFRGNLILYELFELVKDYLTTSNRPAGDCPICLFGFHPNDDFVHTDCYHHFHKHCLYRYVKSTKASWEDEDADLIARGALHHLMREERKIVCPMCRLEINVSDEDLANAALPVEYAEAPESYVSSEDVVNLQKQMESIYLKQKMKGAIIDPKDEVPVLVLHDQPTNAVDAPSTSHDLPEPTENCIPSPVLLEDYGKHLPKGPNVKSRKFRENAIKPSGRNEENFRENSTYGSHPTEPPQYRNEYSKQSYKNSAKTCDSYNTSYKSWSGANYSRKQDYSGYYDRPSRHYQNRYNGDKYHQRNNYDKVEKRSEKKGLEEEKGQKNGRTGDTKKVPPPGFDTSAIRAPPGFDK